MKNTCENCKFWDEKYKEPVWDHGDAAECKRYPPVLETRECAIDTERIESIGTMQDPSRFSWPVTWGHDWCGEYQVTANVELIAGERREEKL
jgi:hypothetical protein